MVFNTGETSEELKAKYNPEGSILRQAQLRMLDMLLYLDNICKEQNIAYRLDGGTVLGAVRHGGFIPWDDDLDVVIDSKKDFKKLCNYLENHPHNQYVIQSHKNDNGFYYFWVTLRDTMSEYIHNNKQTAVIDELRKYRGLQIDIFPYESKRIPFLNKISGKITRMNTKILLPRHTVSAALLYKTQKYIIHPILNLVSLLLGKKNSYMHSYGTTFPYVFPKDTLFPYKNINFEGHSFPAPSKPEEFLTILYGKYMDLPAKEKRNHHDVSYKIW